MAPATEQKPRAADISQLAINTIRFLSVDAVEKANSGHPGTPMALAPVAYTLYTQVMKHNPKNPTWANRDRFVLSAGHASMLLYSTLFLTGYDLSLDDLKNFRQWRSKTPGHPEYGHTQGVETTTGPLGQGLSTAVGMAIAQRYLNGLFSGDGEKPLLDHRIYGIASDGDIMEGVASEAASLAGHLGLSSLIFFYDDNRITIEGSTDLALTENVGDRFKAYNWNVLKVDDANDLNAIQSALRDAQRETARPTLIVLRSHIGYGSPKVDSEEAHGAAFGPDVVAQSKKNLGWPADQHFYVPEEALKHCRECVEKGAAAEKDWQARFDAWAKAHPEKAALWKRLADRKLPDGWEAKLPDFQNEDKIATRAASGKVINALAPIMPELIGGSADLASSNNTLVKGAPSFSKTVAGRNLHFGVREHAMAAAMNGIALSKMLIPYGGTFFIFTDYMKGGMRISALSKIRTIFVLTHDSIGLGEDGPTHQPIEQLAHFRALPNTLVIRPADAVETAAAWKVALTHKEAGPVLLVLTRQALPVLKKAKYPSAGAVEKGGYVLSEAKGGTPRAILIATGSEVALALSAQEKLEAENIPTRVVSLPCWELFGAQTKEYRDSVLPPAVKARVSIEALSTMGWERWVGDGGDMIGMRTFGESAPAPVSFDKFGFNVPNVVDRVKKLL